MCNVRLYIYTVPIPTVNLTAPNTQIVGQSLTLECSVTTVRGITSRVDIVWSSDGTELRKLEGPSPISVESQIVAYSDIYSITQLNTSYDGLEFQCEVVINSPLPITASDITTLDVSGESCDCFYSV